MKEHSPQSPSLRKSIPTRDRGQWATSTGVSQRHGQWALRTMNTFIERLQSTREQIAILLRGTSRSSLLRLNETHNKSAEVANRNGFWLHLTRGGQLHPQAARSHRSSGARVRFMNASRLFSTAVIFETRRQFPWMLFFLSSTLEMCSVCTFMSSGRQGGARAGKASYRCTSRFSLSQRSGSWHSYYIPLSHRDPLLRPGKCSSAQK
jgi:hypothetical protein